ncbi:MAG TPA: toll/interleukin-1 receptor domain-containing protein [Chloroflexia bacterium]|nr:toll/interleukin-1 receptor domain-containing protein [Chloroflexia bacterium]
MANPEHVAILKQGVAVWNKWRQENPTIRLDLREADLEEADLYKANLTGAELTGAKLGWADLTAARLEWANLSLSNFYRANLLEANLSWADLSGTNLNRADLSGAYFIEAKLDKTNFNWATMGRTILGTVNFTTAIGLDTVKHIAPSIIGIDTIYLSKGTMPEVFLRGVGVPDEIIALQAALRGNPIEFYSVFISYSHADKSFARRLHDGLQGRGIRCWLDEKEMLPGDDIFEQVDRGIKLWDKVLLCCSQHSLRSWWVDDEITRVFAKEQSSMKKRRGKRVLALIPLNLDGYMFTRKWKSAKVTQIKARLAADFTGWEQDNTKFEEQFERVVKALRTGDGGRGEPPESKL